MDYDGLIIRPPSEAESAILQVTVGCSHNKCTFCGAYKMKKFGIKEFDLIKEDIEEIVRDYPWTRRVFLCDGDPLILSQNRLLQILRYLKERLPELERVGIYGNTKSVLKKSVEQLKELREEGLGIVYLGLESGSDEILEEVKKGVTTAQMISAARRVRESKILLSVTILLGLGGVDKSYIHARQSGKVLTQMDPDYIGALTLMVIPGTPFYFQVQRGEITLIDPFQTLEELGIMISELNPTNCLFRSNHASNYLPLGGWLPREKEKILKVISDVLSNRDKSRLRPEFLRAL
ncbi:MAG: radical SAM protein [Armatimonadetes bacterium CG07_land_8_20_14_0_80_40_9]|nr:MAG: radical SAM protein [Armatimonadetes bacterium CG07_land_8_20_14_0_80_40_9]